VLIDNRLGITNENFIPLITNIPLISIPKASRAESEQAPSEWVRLTRSSVLQTGGPVSRLRPKLTVFQVNGPELICRSSSFVMAGTARVGQTHSVPKLFAVCRSMETVTAGSYCSLSRSSYSDSLVAAPMCGSDTCGAGSDSSR
jgi:hypothetical protein